MTSAAMAKCYFCGALCDTTKPSNYREVTGWARMRRRGVNEVARRVDTGRFAHADCVKRSVSQSALFS